jgi:hypothetical protein
MSRTLDIETILALSTNRTDTEIRKHLSTIPKKQMQVNLLKFCIK